MSAKEMFEELGYECKIAKFKGDIINIEYIGDDEYSSNIRFNLENKSFNVWYGENEYSGGITMEIYKAINKQVEELGWEDK